MRTVSEKESIISSRGESSIQGSKTRLYQVYFNDGKSCGMVCMNGESIEEAEQSCIDRFGKNYKRIEGRND